MNPKTDIASPCIRVCTLNEQDVCLGCGRTLEEIKRWSLVSDQEKKEILELAADRRTTLHRASPHLSALFAQRTRL